MTTNRARWSDNDHYFGPFTYARDRHCRTWAIELSSGNDEYPGNQLRLSGFGRTLIMALPAIIRPWRRKVTFAHITEAQRADIITRIGRDWYWDTYRRVYGFSLSGSGDVGESTFLHVCYGARTHDSSTDMDWGYFLPWTRWRHVRHSLYDLTGAHFADMPESRRMLDTWNERKAIEDACPVRAFPFLDFDGEVIEATTRIEEREWRLGEGWWKWLSWFRRPQISRSLDIRFSKETGQRKGSWKGGTTGHSIDMQPGELHEAAFRRYCAEHQMSFGGR